MGSARGRQRARADSLQPTAARRAGRPMTRARLLATTVSAIRPVVATSSSASGRISAGQCRAATAASWPVRAPRLMPPRATGPREVRRAQAISAATSEIQAWNRSRKPTGPSARAGSPP